MFVEFIGYLCSFVLFFAPVALLGAVVLLLLGAVLPAPRGGRYTRRSGADAARAALRAALSPICGAKASEDAARLRAEGAGTDATAAYFVSKTAAAPEGAISAGLLIGLPAALLRWVLAAGSAMLTGFVCTPSERMRQLKKNNAAAYAEKKAALRAARAPQPATALGERLRAAVRALPGNVRAMLPGLAVGCVAGAALATALPDTFFADIGLVGTMLCFFLCLSLGFLVGAPALSAAPVLLGLLLRGLGPGPALFVLCAAPVFNITELYNIGRVIGRGKTVIYMLANTLPALVVSKLFQDIVAAKLIGYAPPAVSASPAENAGFAVGVVCAVLLLVLLGISLAGDLRRSREEHADRGDMKLFLSGAWGEQTEQILQDALSALPGISVLAIRRERGTAVLSGTAEFDVLAEAVRSAGLSLDRTEE